MKRTRIALWLVGFALMSVAVFAAAEEEAYPIGRVYKMCAGDVIKVKAKTVYNVTQTQTSNGEESSKTEYEQVKDEDLDINVIEVDETLNDAVKYERVYNVRHIATKSDDFPGTEYDYAYIGKIITVTRDGEQFVIEGDLEESDKENLRGEHEMNQAAGPWFDHLIPQAEYMLGETWQMDSDEMVQWTADAFMGKGDAKKIQRDSFTLTGTLENVVGDIADVRIHLVFKATTEAEDASLDVEFDYLIRVDMRTGVWAGSEIDATYKNWSVYDEGDDIREYISISKVKSERTVEWNSGD